MTICPSCGKEVAAGKFCSECGAPLVVPLPREAVALGEPSDMLAAKADAFVDLAEVLTAAGQRDGAADALDSAAGLYAEKGHLVGVARVQSLRAGLAAPIA